MEDANNRGFGMCYKGRMIVKMVCSELLRENAADHQQADRRGRDWMLTSRRRRFKLLGNASLPTRCTRHQKTPYRFMYITVSIPHTDLE